MLSILDRYAFVLVPMISWFVAQLLKFIFVIAKYKKFDFTRFVGSGGMPSGHSAFIVSLATLTANRYGFDSFEFGLTFAIAMIIMYDATGVRRAAGKQARVLNKIIYAQGSKINVEERLKELLGHTPIEVFVGALLGMAIALLIV